MKIAESIVSVLILVLIAAFTTATPHTKPAPISVPREEVSPSTPLQVRDDAPEADESMSDSTAEAHDAIEPEAVSFLEEPGVTRHETWPTSDSVANENPVQVRADYTPPDHFADTSKMVCPTCAPAVRYAVPAQHYFRAGPGQGCAVCGKSIYDTVHPWRNVSAHVDAPQQWQRQRRALLPWRNR